MSFLCPTRLACSPVLWLASSASTPRTAPFVDVVPGMRVVVASALFPGLFFCHDQLSPPPRTARANSAADPHIHGLFSFLDDFHPLGTDSALNAPAPPAQTTVKEALAKAPPWVSHVSLLGGKLIIEEKSKDLCVLFLDTKNHRFPKDIELGGGFDRQAKLMRREHLGFAVERICCLGGACSTKSLAPQRAAASKLAASPSLCSPLGNVAARWWT